MQNLPESECSGTVRVIMQATCQKSKGGVRAFIYFRPVIMAFYTIFLHKAQNPIFETRAEYQEQE